MGIFRKDTNTQAFEELVRPHVDRLYRFAYRLTGNRADAEDLVQDLVVKLHEQWKTLADLDQPGTWMAKVLYRIYVDNVRRSARSPLRLVEDVESESATLADAATAQSDAIVSHLEQDHYVRQVARALEQLSPEHRVVITLHDVEGYHISEIEEITGLATGTVKSRLHRGRARLRELLDEGTFSAPQACRKAGGEQI